LKVMFIAAVARPQYDSDGNCVFDGKLGIWPLVHKEQAQRNSVNRQAGTWETKTVSCTAEVYKQVMFDKVLPAIRHKLPHERCHGKIEILLQHDNAPSGQGHQGRRSACSKVPSLHGDRAQALGDARAVDTAYEDYSSDANRDDYTFESDNE